MLITVIILAMELKALIYSTMAGGRMSPDSGKPLNDANQVHGVRKLNLRAKVSFN